MTSKKKKKIQKLMPNQAKTQSKFPYSPAFSTEGKEQIIEGLVRLLWKTFFMCPSALISFSGVAQPTFPWLSSEVPWNEGENAKG